MQILPPQAPILALLALMVAGCGGGGSSTVPDATTITSRNLTATNDPANIGVTFESGTDVATFTVDGVELSDIDREPDFDNGDVKLYRDFSQGISAFAVSTPDSAGAVLQRSGILTPKFSGATFARLTEVTIPESGSSDYAGDYAGYIRETEDGTPQIFRYVNGDVSLMVDFETNEVSGAITNRVTRFNGGNQIDLNNPLADVTLETTALDAQGGFAGSATGGQLLRGGDDTTLATSRYGGLVSGGDSLGEVVGAVVIDHSCCTDEAMTEVGIFLAN